MRRRDLIKLIAISAAWPLAARAQQTDRVYRIGLLRIGPPPPSFIEPLRHALSELGHVEGKSFVFDLGIAADVEQLPNLAAELIRRKVDVILASGTPAVLPARNATSTVPVVFVAAIDPVETGMVTSLARPGGNVTGLTAVFADPQGDAADAHARRASLATGQSWPRPIRSTGSDGGTESAGRAPGHVREQPRRV
jgi:putative ABC transport system substrate-binding protein